MNIKEFSEQSHISPYTLRYYEKIGLLKNVKRGANGHRFYTSGDLDWVRFILRLKETGMPLEEIKQYADLRELGESTMSARQQLLKQHHVRLKQSIDIQLELLDALEKKITFYNEQITA